MPEYDPRVRHRIYWLQLGAYLLIVVVTAAGFYFQERTQNQLCAGAAQNRVAVRSVVNATADLGRDLILGDADQPSTPEQGAALYRVETFRAKQLNALELPVCID